MEHAGKRARELELKTYGFMTNAVVNMVLEQTQAVNADGHLTVGVAKPEALMYALFARLSKTASEDLAEREPGVQSHAESVLGLLRRMVELCRLSQDEMLSMQRGETHEYMATVLVKKAVMQAHDALAQVCNSAFGSEVGSGSKRKHSPMNGDADTGVVVEAIAPLTRILVWSLRGPNEYEQNVAEDLERVAMNLDLTVSHMTRLIELDKLVLEACREHTRRAETTGAFKHLNKRLAVHEQSLSAAQQKFDDLCRKTVLFVTDSAGKIKQWNHGAEFLTGFETAGVMGRNVCELCVCSDPVAALVMGLAAETMSEVQVEMKTQNEPVCVRLNICCTGEQDFDVLWCGTLTDLKPFVQRIDELANDHAKSLRDVAARDQELSNQAKKIEHLVEAQASTSREVAAKEQELRDQAKKIEDLEQAQITSSAQLAKKDKELAEKVQSMEALAKAQAQSAVELAEKDKELVLVRQKLRDFVEWSEKTQELAAREREIFLERQKLKECMPENV